MSLRHGAGQHVSRPPGRPPQDGILKIKLSGGQVGKGNLQVIGNNTDSTLPRGIASSLQSQSGATVQVLTSDASCFGTALPRVKKANGVMFSAVGP